MNKKINDKIDLLTNKVDIIEKKTEIGNVEYKKLFEAQQREREKLENLLTLQEEKIRLLERKNEHTVKNNISKERFCEIMRNIQADLDSRHRFSDCIEDINSDGLFICNIGDRWLDSLLDLLVDIVEEPDDSTDRDDSLIEWWVFTDEDKTSPEKLYDSIISAKEAKKNYENS